MTDIKWDHSIKSGTAFSPVATAKMVANVQTGERVWISKQKALCLKCQKDVLRHLGRYSFLVPPKVWGRALEGHPKKFICFACKPKELF